LPRKFNIAVSGAAQHASVYWSQDLSLLATRDEENEIVYQVLVGGTQGQNPRLAWALPIVVRPDQAVLFTKALLDIFRELGAREKRDQARLRYLIERIGIGGLINELTKRLPFPLQPCVREPQPPIGYDELVGWFRSRERGKWSLGISVPVGRLSWQQLEGMAIAAERWGSGNLRTTHEQGLLIVDIPTGFKDAAATAAASVGLSPHADSLVRNTVACTGKQFCNIAVTETKGQMLRLIEALRKRGVTLHGIRIHMSGCPSSCAQHHTADIGLKGVRVRRLLGTTEGFDVYLGGGVAGNIHLGLLYKLGVDEGQLPVLVEEVVHEYYLRHRVGQTFSAYWREELQNREATKVGDHELTPPVWLCEACDYHHRGEDPPVYCPQCAGLRRHFARLDQTAPNEEPNDATPAPVARPDGFLPIAEESRIPADRGYLVEVAGKELALFRTTQSGETKIVALDNACPHSGGPLAEGTCVDGVVTCPWHGWQFNACDGCRADRPGKGVASYPCLIEEGRVLVKLPVAESVTV
jgi:dissimilatory sulfite reductase (desulfoviridin) alpha/beta subunit/nitrite reductase/ring-hydroxylating ferredoxin subunit